ncbi:MAG: carboxypeptidase regulatory-like domain-containing protein, partial [Acidobacteria bacterium]|nr:carboxypeptidase regulatory-like domain-containing protein [Acidobacteriota bacterium]
MTIGSVAVLGQEFRGTVAGTVSDLNRAVVAGATVLVKNRATNVSQTVLTNSEGAFSKPCSYSLEFMMFRFRAPALRGHCENSTVAVDDRLSIDFTLEIGADVPRSAFPGRRRALEQGTVNVGRSVSQRQIEELLLAEGAPIP